MNATKETVSTVRNFSALSGVDKAAISLLILGEERSEQILGDFSDSEIVTVSRAMTSIGKVPVHLIREACEALLTKMGQGEALHGNLATVQRILAKSMGEERMASIMEELTAPAGKTTWEKLSSINAETLASFLETEGEQTAAVVLTRLVPEHAARVLEAFTEDFQSGVVTRIIDLDPVPRDTLNEIEGVLQSEFMATLGRGSIGSDSTHVLAEIFNRASSEFTERTLTAVSAGRPDQVANIQSRMFTFHDLVNLDSITADRICSSVELPTLVVALKSAPDKLVEHIISAAGLRRGGLIRDELAMLPAKRKRDIKAAQNEVLKVAKKLEAEGEITLKVQSEDDQLVE